MMKDGENITTKPPRFVLKLTHPLNNLNHPLVLNSSPDYRYAWNKEMGSNKIGSETQRGRCPRHKASFGFKYHCSSVDKLIGRAVFGAQDSTPYVSNNVNIVFNIEY